MKFRNLSSHKVFNPPRSNFSLPQYLSFLEPCHVNLQSSKYTVLRHFLHKKGVYFTPHLCIYMKTKDPSNNFLGFCNLEINKLLLINSKMWETPFCFSIFVLLTDNEWFEPPRGWCLVNSATLAFTKLEWNIQVSSFCWMS